MIKTCTTGYTRVHSHECHWGEGTQTHRHTHIADKKQFQKTCLLAGEALSLTPPTPKNVGARLDQAWFKSLIKRSKNSASTNN